MLQSFCGRLTFGIGIRHWHSYLHANPRRTPFTVQKLEAEFQQLCNALNPSNAYDIWNFGF